MTDEEILDILLQIRATGTAEAAAVNQILANTGNVATTTGAQVGTLTAAHEAQALALQTVGGYTTTYGEALTAQEASYARLQLSSKEVSAVTRDVSSEASAAARALGGLGSQGAYTAERVAALGGIMGAGGALGIGIGAGIVALGAAGAGMKSMVDIAEANEVADKSLAQAYATLGEKVPTQQIDAFITTNRAVIPSIAAVKEGFATVTRAGMDNTMQMRLMNDALDLSAAKGIDLGTAINTLLMAESGRATGLLQLGINVRTVTDPQKELTTAIKAAEKATLEKQVADRRLAEEQQRLHDAHKVTQNDLMTLQDLRAKDYAATQNLTDAQQNLGIAQKVVADGGDKFKSILDQLEPKIKNARSSSSDLHQSMSALSTDWQHLAEDYGPSLVGILGQVAKGLDAPMNNGFWAGVQNGTISDLKSGSLWLQTQWILHASGPNGWSPAELKRLKSQWPEAYAAVYGADPPTPAGFGSEDTSGPPKAGPGSYEAAQRAQKLLDSTGQGATAGALTPGSTIVPPLVQAQLDAKTQAMADAKRLQQQNDRIIATLERVEANTKNPIVPRLSFNVQGLSAADQQTERILARAMRV